jgi:glutaminase
VDVPTDTAADRAERRAWFAGACRELHERYTGLTDGEPASYIPELAEVDPDRFAIAASPIDGGVVQVGDVDQTFTIQSISKLLVYGLALELHGRERVLRTVGVAPTGDSFNAIELDEATNRAPNPMVNAGAIAVTDLIAADGIDDGVARMQAMYERYLGRRPEIDHDVWRSERSTGDRNRAIAYLMRGRGIVGDDVESTLDVYFAQCSVLVTAADLAVIGATIANHGVHPTTGERVVPREVTRDMLTVALTCGMYDYAGEWAYTVGIPAKSGVGGGILGILPGVGGIATFSPRLDEIGNSVRGLRVFEELSERFELHLFDPDRPWRRH